jgi:hypothetical protein
MISDRNSRSRRRIKNLLKRENPQNNKCIKLFFFSLDYYYGYGKSQTQTKKLSQFFAGFVVTPSPTNAGRQTMEK